MRNVIIDLASFFVVNYYLASRDAIVARLMYFLRYVILNVLLL